MNRAVDGNLSCYNLWLFCQFINIFKVAFICHNELKLPFWVYTDTGGRFTYVFLFSDIMEVIRPKWIYMQQLKNKTAFGRKRAFPSFLFSFFSLVCLQFRFKSREAFKLLQSSSVSREQKIIMKKRNTKIRYQQTVSISRQLFPF